MSAASSPTRRYQIGRSYSLVSKKRPAVIVTLRQQMELICATVIEGEPKPLVVTIDEGLCAGIRLWAAEREIFERGAL